MRPNRSLLVPAAFLVVSLAGCRSGGADQVPGDAARTSATTTTSTASSTTTTTSSSATTLAAAATTAGATGATGAPAAAPAAEEHVLLQTTAGDILIDLFEDRTPGHAENMKKLVRQGYYVNSPFHRVIDGFMAQGGGQWSASGPGGVEDVGYTIPAEIVPGLRHVRGSVAAARKPDQVNPGRESSGSQFYIAYGETPHLDGGYTVFGQVISGLENVDKIVKGAPRTGAFADQSQATTIKAAKLVPASAR